MKTEDLIGVLKENKYSFEQKDNQIIVKLAKRHSLNLYIENDTIVRSKDVFKQFGLSTSEKSLGKATKTSFIVGSIIIVSCIVILFIFAPEILSDFSGVFLVVGLVYTMLCPLFEYWFFNRRLLKIKKLLNLNS